MQKFNGNIEKTKYEPDKLDDDTKLLETHEDSKWKKGTNLTMGDSILSGLRKHFILKFLPDVELFFFNTSNKNREIKRK